VVTVEFTVTTTEVVAGIHSAPISRTAAATATAATTAEVTEEVTAVTIAITTAEVVVVASTVVGITLAEDATVSVATVTAIATREGEVAERRADHPPCAASGKCASRICRRASPGRT